MIKRKDNPLFVSANLLIQLASLVVHYQEWTSTGGHSVDKSAIDSIENDPEVKAWFDKMKSLGFLPAKRNE